MIIYLLPFITLTTFSFKDIVIKKNKKNTNKIILAILVIYLIVIAGFREGMGKDFYAYKMIFNEINSVSDHGYLEFGFRLFVVLIKKITNDPKYMFLAFSIVTLLPLKSKLRENSDYPLLSLLIYLSIFYTSYVFNGMRQAVAMTAFICSIDSILTRNTKKVLLWTLLGLSFHNSAIIILISYLISFSGIRLTKTGLIVTSVVLIIIFFSNSYAIGIITSFLPSFLRTKLILYIQSYKSGVTLIGLMQRVVILILFLIQYKKANESDTFRILFPAYYIGFIVYLLFSFQDQFATRINMFFRILEIFLIPALLSTQEKLSNRIIIFVLLILWLSSVYFSIVGNPYYLPYQSVLSF